jgi:hypothetical protein
VSGAGYLHDANDDAFESAALRFCDPISLIADFSNDLYRYNPTTRVWTALSPSGTKPSKREFTGFTATPGGKLYAYGGLGYFGDTLEAVHALVFFRPHVEA